MQTRCRAEVPHGAGAGLWYERSDAKYEAKTGSAPAWSRVGRANLVGVVAEFLGTALYVFVGCGALASSSLGGTVDVLAVSLAFGLIHIVLAFAFAPISGAHFNPLITAAVTAAGRCRVLVALMYTGAQVAGGIIGALMVRGCMPERCVGELLMRQCVSGQDRLALAANVLMSDVSAGRGVLAEIIGTFLVVTVVLRVVVDGEGAAVTRALSPVAVGLAISAAHLVLIPLTNCSLNPARSLGVSVVADRWDDHWVFWVGPTVGALCSLVFYKAGLQTVEPRAAEMSDGVEPTAAGSAVDMDARPPQSRSAAVPSQAMCSAPADTLPTGFSGPSLSAPAQPQQQTMARYGDQWLPCTVAERGANRALVVWQDGSSSWLDPMDVK